MTSNASIRAAVEHVLRQGHLTNHQAAAFSALDRQLTAKQAEAFTADWRAQGSPAAPAPTPPRPSNPLAGFPWFSQLDNGPGGARQCQTSAISMCLKFLQVPGILDDLDYLRVVRRYGDTTEQAAHRRALDELQAPGRFIQNGTEDLVRREILAGRPVAMAGLHTGPLDNPGGGHWIACYGFDAAARVWIVNDPYGELDLVSGTWDRTGGTAGRGQRYSWANWARRWSPEGPGNGWCWLFD
jgi:Peptidase_C39 like family